MISQTDRQTDRQTEHELTGFLSVDKPWLKYYGEEVRCIVHYQKVRCMII